jgi:hypothetical protein
MEIKYKVRDIYSNKGDFEKQLNNFSKSGWELVATSTKINTANVIDITCIFKTVNKTSVLDLKKQLNEFILDQKKVLEDIHYTLMYSDKKQQDVEMDRLFLQTKRAIVKAQQCIDILNEI